MQFGWPARLAGALALATIPLAMPVSGADETIKIAYIDPLSGGMANVGEDGLKTFVYLADELNGKGGALGKKFEIIGYDNKLNAQETLVQVQKAIDSGIRIITQGNGSAFAHAISDFVTKYNERNPGKEVIYFNYAAVDPALTNDKCSFWHFRWDANSDQKMQALTNYMKDRKTIKKVYLINQDYSFGQAVRAAAVKMVKEKLPGVEIVGDELHPLAKITDFSPYVAKIKASGADSVITGNWGNDFALLLKAAADAGLQTDWYTYYAGGPGGPVAIKQAGLNHRVFAITEGFPNGGNASAEQFERAFRAKYKTDGAGGTSLSLFYPRAVNEMRMLQMAIEKAKSVEPKNIASALEGMKFNVLNGGEGYMRADDHQMIQPIYIASLGERSAKEPFDEEGTGWGWKVAGKVEAADTVLPTTCKMSRPAS